MNYIWDMGQATKKARPCTAGWEHFHHGADIGIRGTGPDLAAAFEQAAMALTAVITEPQCVRPARAVDIELSEPDAELLLLDWLNRLVYEMATRHMLFGRFDVDIRDGRLLARAWGEPLEPARHRPAVEVKGATCSELRVARLPDGGWLAQCVVDV